MNEQPNEPLANPTDHAKLYYELGKRDAMAALLAENFKIHRLPELAKRYAASYERHFSHDWHTGE